MSKEKSKSSLFGNLSPSKSDDDKKTPTEKEKKSSQVQTTLKPYAPFIVFLILMFLSLITILMNPGNHTDKQKHLMFSVLWYLIWALVIYILCRMGYLIIAWILVFIPVILYMLNMIWVFTGNHSSFTSDEFLN